jgi:hypothetical protein
MLIYKKPLISGENAIQNSIKLPFDKEVVETSLNGITYIALIEIFWRIPTKACL